MSRESGFCEASPEPRCAEFLAKILRSGTMVHHSPLMALYEDSRSSQQGSGKLKVSGKIFFQIKSVHEVTLN